MATKNSIHEWLAKARLQLSGCAEQPSLEAQVMLAHVLLQPRAWVIAHPDFSISIQHRKRLDTLLVKRQRGEPLPYLIGHWEFYGLDFTVNPAVLIPRPETELLVEEALRWIKQKKHSLNAIDIGTGSGCIAVSLAKHAPDLRILATDVSRAALNTCRLNATAGNSMQDQVTLVQADLLEPFCGPFDLVCANLPYIPTSKLAQLEVARHEPALALDGGTDGLRLVEPLLVQAASRMAPGGLLLLEIEFEQGEQSVEIARRLFPRAAIQVLPDLAGLPRLLRIEQNQ